MRNYIFKIVCCLVPILFWQCGDPIMIGEEIVRNEILDVNFVDTVSIKLSTVKYDSFPSSNDIRHLVGYHYSKEIGSIHARSFFYFNKDSLPTALEEDAEFLRAEFELIHDGYFYFDTVAPFSLSMYPIEEEWELNDEGLLSNLSEVSYLDAYPIGTYQFQPRPQRKGSIFVAIDQDYAMSIFDFLQNEETDVLTEFDEQFPGLLLAVDTTLSQCFLGFSPSSRLILHYEEGGEEKALRLSTNRLRFNQLLHHPSGSLLEGISTLRDDISSSETEHLAFLQNGAGLGIKVEFVSLDEVRAVLNENFIIEATLVLRPMKGTYSNTVSLPSDLRLYEIDELNRIRQPLVNNIFLNIDREFQEETEYRMVITDFIKEKVNDLSTEEDAILIQGGEGSFTNSVDRLIVGDEQNSVESHLELLILDYIIDNN